MQGEARANVADVSEAVVREYLARSGLQRTLAVFDEERPRRAEAISTRTALMKALHIEALVKHNKQRASPYASMLEMLVDRHVMRPLKRFATAQSSASMGGASQSGGAAAASSSAAAVAFGMSSVVPGAAAVATPPAPLEEAASGAPGSGEQADVPPGPLPPAPSSPSGSWAMRVSSVQAPTGGSLRRVPDEWMNAEPLDGSTLHDLRAALVGKRHVPSEWCQGLYYAPAHNRALAFGLIQGTGGPCAALASLQAEVLSLCHSRAINPLALSEKQRVSLLQEAVASIVWRSAPDVAGEAQVVVSVRMAEGGARPLHRSVETVRGCRSERDVLAVVQTHWSSFARESGDGVLLFVCSVVLTRGIEAMFGDMDDRQPLIGQHNYAALEMFNLLLYGRAFSNVFDGVKELGGGADAMVLRGAPHQGHYGLLTLVEHYDQLHVGAHLKQPRYPVWVVHSEGHFSVLFVPSGAHPDDSGHFDLTYYDQLGGYDEPFRLTVDPRAGVRVDEAALTPPVDHVIRTRWPGAAVSWNGHDPIY